MVHQYQLARKTKYTSGTLTLRSYVTSTTFVASPDLLLINLLLIVLANPLKGKKVNYLGNAHLLLIIIRILAVSLRDISVSLLYFQEKMLNAKKLCSL